MKNKVNKGLLITVIVLVLVIGLLIFKLTKDTVSTNKDKNKTSDNNTQVIDKVEGAKDFDLKEAEQILDKFGFNTYIGCGSNIYESFYSEPFKGSIVLKKVSDSEKSKKKCSELYTEESKYNSSAYQGEYGVCYKDKEATIIPYDEANKIYTSMYGTDMPKKGFNTSNVSGMYYNFYDYNDSLNSFVQLECGGCGGACGPSLTINKIKSAYTIGDNLVIDVYYFYTTELRTGVTASLEGGYKEEEYKLLSTTKNGDIKLESKDLESAKKEIEEKYLDKLDTYEVVFTKKDGNYIFKSLTKKLS